MMLCVNEAVQQNSDNMAKIKMSNKAVLEIRVKLNGNYKNSWYIARSFNMKKNV